MIIGAQLYSVCDRCKTQEDLNATLKAMKEIGYTTVQLSGFPFDPEATRKCADELGLHIGLTHTDIKKVMNETDEVIRIHKIIGAEMVGIGWPGGYTDGKTVEVDRLIADLLPATKKIEAAGLKFGYHNHAMEFADMGGYTAMDVLFEKTDWMFILDAGWMDYAGADNVACIKKFASRLMYVHLKEFSFKDGRDKAKIVPIYHGDTPMDTIIPALIAAGTKIAYVEQDGANQYGDSWAEMKKSYDAIKEHGFIQ